MEQKNYKDQQPRQVDALEPIKKNDEPINGHEKPEFTFTPTKYDELLGGHPSTFTKEDLATILNNALKKWTRRLNVPALEYRQEAERMVALINEALKELL